MPDFPGLPFKTTMCTFVFLGVQYKIRWGSRKVPRVVQLQPQDVFQEGCDGKGVERDSERSELIR